MIVQPQQAKGPEVADIFRQFGPAYRSEHKLSWQQHKAINAIVACRTAALGGYIDQCDHCGYERTCYCSCRNRHCPKCQALARERWLLARKQDLLPIRYFHVVLTMPDSLNPLALQNQKVVYGILFKAGSETLLELGRDRKHLGAEIGIIALLHTWGQNLMDHPHLHCIVTGGGLAQDSSKWIYPKKTQKGNEFFVHVNVISELFKKKFIYYLREAYDAGQLKFVGKISYLQSKAQFNRFKDELYNKKWVTYCKETFGNPEHVINYLGGYTHRVAISNSRIVQFEDGKVTFKWKDYNDHDKQKLMTVDACEFIRRFLLHILPKGFFKIRYYGILSNRHHKTTLAKCKEILKVIEDSQDCKTIHWLDLFFDLTGIDLRICPVCQQGRMRSKAIIKPLSHSPPEKV
jgi:hypothetical protein